MTANLARNYVVAVNIGPLVALAGIVRALVEETKPKETGQTRHSPRTPTSSDRNQIFNFACECSFQGRGIG